MILPAPWARMCRAAYFVYPERRESAGLFARAASARNHTLGVRPAARPTDNFVGVTFAMMVTELAEASQVIKIINGEIEPP
jgi:hypothetical protein